MKQKKQDDKDKKVFGKMFSKPGAFTPKDAPAPTPAAEAPPDAAEAAAEDKPADDERITPLDDDTRIS
jgi:hypothetical protein